MFDLWFYIIFEIESDYKISVYDIIIMLYYTVLY